ncbi:hypothetical protein ANCDUO_03278 [Ancylostoma duodenale]|uniref:Uncharacterized protein n=1 Tax=Ancylostoma duodenale TaxID=51022 RepID=A0A0C2GY19_9BILA|nr:hypothetical protein ANCDUO_03278 [Ancylostoma duodenale]
MASVVLLLALIAAAQACPPATTTSKAPNTDAASTTAPTTATAGSARKRRDLETVLVTAVTNQKYDPSMNGAHLRSMRAMVSTFARGARSQAKFITRLGVRCGGRPEFLIN